MGRGGHSCKRFERQTAVPRASQASWKPGTYATGRFETAMQMSLSFGPTIGSITEMGPDIAIRAMRSVWSELPIA